MGDIHLIVFVSSDQDPAIFNPAPGPADAAFFQDILVADLLPAASLEDTSKNLFTHHFHHQHTGGFYSIIDVYEHLLVLSRCLEKSESREHRKHYVEFLSGMEIAHVCLNKLNIQFLCRSLHFRLL